MSDIRSKMYTDLQLKYPILFLSYLNFFYRFLKHTQISNFVKIRPVGVKLFHVDRQTNMTKLMVTFRYFANMPKNQKSTVHFYSN